MNYEEAKKNQSSVLQTSEFRLPRGFTLLEVMAAISVLTLAVGGSFILIKQTLVSVSVLQSKLIASYLAQEGIEIIRNIRDSNWLSRRTDPAISWDSGLDEGDWQVDFDDTKDQILPYGSEGDFLYLDYGGFYSYSPVIQTPFKRRVTISEKTDLDGDEEPDKMRVTVEVSWQSRGKDYKIQATEYLYNWHYWY